MSRLLDEERVRLDGKGACLSVSGDVGFDVAAALAARGSAWLAGQPAGSQLVLDLRGVEHVSSVAISVLLEWARCAQSVNVSIEEVLLSTPLERLAQMAGLDRLLPLSPAT